MRGVQRSCSRSSRYSAECRCGPRAEDNAWRAQRLQTPSLLRAIPAAEFQNVAGLTVERLADARERIEADAPDLARFQQRDVLFGDADALGELLRPHLSPRQHDVEIDDDRHWRPHTKLAFSSARRAASRMTVATATSTPPTTSAK